MDKAAQLFNQIAKVDSTYVSKKNPKVSKIDFNKRPMDTTLAPQGSPVSVQTRQQRSYKEVFGNKPNPPKMELKSQQTQQPVQTQKQTTQKSTGNFSSAFADARKQGLSEFSFGGKKYTTQIKGEAPKKDFKYVNESLPNKTQSLVKNVKENTPVTVTGQNKSKPIIAKGMTGGTSLKQRFDMTKVSNSEAFKAASLWGSLAKGITKIKPMVAGYGKNVAKDWSLLKGGFKNVNTAQTPGIMDAAEQALMLERGQRQMARGLKGLGKRVGLPVAGGAYLLNRD